MYSLAFSSIKENYLKYQTVLMKCSQFCCFIHCSFAHHIYSALLTTINSINWWLSRYSFELFCISIGLVVPPGPGPRSGFPWVWLHLTVHSFCFRSANIDHIALWLLCMVQATSRFAYNSWRYKWSSNFFRTDVGPIIRHNQTLSLVYLTRSLFSFGFWSPSFSFNESERTNYVVLCLPKSSSLSDIPLQYMHHTLAESLVYLVLNRNLCWSKGVLHKNKTQISFNQIKLL